MSTSGWSEPLCLDPPRVVAEVDEDVRHRLDEAGRAAHEAARLDVRSPPVCCEVVGADPAGWAWPALRCGAGVDVGDVAAVAGPLQAAQLGGVVPLVGCADRVEGGERPPGPGPSPGPGHRYQRHDARAPATSSPGWVSVGCQTNHPPTGPRISTGSPVEMTSVRYGDASPFVTRCTVSSTRSPSA